MSQPVESVAVVGAGAMGAMYAAHFVEGGLRTSLVASGERAGRLRDPGLVVNGTPLAVGVLDPDVDPLEPVDLVVVAVKHHDLAAAMDDVAPFVGPETTLVSVLNGLDSEEVLAERFGPEGLLLCIALGMAAGREGREVTYLSPGQLTLGTAPGLASTDRVHAVTDALDRAGLRWETSPSPGPRAYPSAKPTASGGTRSSPACPARGARRCSRTCSPAVPPRWPSSPIAWSSSAGGTGCPLRTTSRSPGSCTTRRTETLRS